MYHGEVSVQEEELPALLKIAEALKVKGLVENDENKSGSTGSPIRTKPTQTTSGSGTTPNSKTPLWPLIANKLMSPKSKPENGRTVSTIENSTDEDPGHLVIDEESKETENITMVSHLNSTCRRRKASLREALSVGRSVGLYVLKNFFKILKLYDRV